MELHKSIERPRIRALDSLRGLAALTVVIAHACGILIKGHTLDEYTPLYLFRAAHESVIFFFLLSGYVLTHQIKNQQYFSYPSFAVQRLFRIYVPYLVVMLFVFFIGFFVNNGEDIGIQNLKSNQASFSKAILDHLILVGNFNTNEYNNVIWSLVHEMRVALLFPVLLYLISFRSLPVIYGLFLTSLLVGLAVIFNVEESKGYNNGYLYTVHYFSFFVLGSLLVKHTEIISNWYLGLNRKIKSLGIILALLVLCYSRMLFLIPHKFGYLRISLFNEFVADWLTAISAAFLMVYAIHIVNKSNLLLNRFPLFLGRISYSLYLIHLPVIFSGLAMISGVNRAIVTVTCVLAAIMLSFLLNKYVEKPAARLGRRFSNSIS